MQVFHNCQRKMRVKPFTVVLEVALLIKTRYKESSHVGRQRQIHRGNITHEAHSRHAALKYIYIYIEKARSRDPEYFSQRFCKLSGEMALNKLYNFKLLNMQ